jgi:hypothetical protein
MKLQKRTIDALTIDDERSFRHVGLYDDLKRALRDDGFCFRVPEPKGAPDATWDRVLFLNLTFWSASEPSDILLDDHVAADVVAHAAWHHLARRALPGPVTAEGLFLGESIASAFDLYLVGRLLGHAPSSDFLETQVPAMSEAAATAGLSEEGFEALLERIAADPDRAFEDLRELLFDAATTLYACADADDAAALLERFAEHPYASLLHHYELSNWILYARAYAQPEAGQGRRDDERVRRIDGALRAANVALDWLQEHWIAAAAH